MDKEKLISKFKNFWYYHKWHLLVAVFLLAAAAIGIHSCQSREKPDLYVLFAHDGVQNPWQADELKTFFGSMTEDVNGDGEPTARVMETSNQNEWEGVSDVSAMLVQVNSGEAVLYILTEETYQILHQNAVLQDLTEFADGSAYIDGDRYLLTESGALKELKNLSNGNDTFYLALRKVDGTTLENSEDHQLQLRLAKSVLSSLIENELKERMHFRCIRSFYWRAFFSCSYLFRVAIPPLIWRSRKLISKISFTFKNSS